MQFAFLKRLDKHLFDVFQKMRCGIWFCEGCEQSTLFLPKYRQDELDFLDTLETGTAGTHSSPANGLQNHGELSKSAGARLTRVERTVPSLNVAKEEQRKLARNPNTISQDTGVSQQTPATEPRVAPDRTPAEPIGNVLRSDESLLVRKARASRYSEKFRESVVKRILSGQTTIAQVRKELKLSERDILDWVAEADRQKEDQIIDLSKTIDSMKRLGWDGGESGSEPVARAHQNAQRSAPNLPIEDDEQIIEGRVNPK